MSAEHRRYVEAIAILRGWRRELPLAGPDASSVPWVRAYVALERRADALLAEAGEGGGIEHAHDAPAMTARLAEVESAVASAGFRVARDLAGQPTLWCLECGRDSGFHHEHCTKASS